MKTKHFYSLLILSITCLFFSLAFSNNQAKNTQIASISIRDSTLCPVCGMKINMNTSFDWKYKDTKYYFDTYNCKTTFKMDPQKFINNVCTPPKQN
jgi:YHS domain-containing protein